MKGRPYRQTILTERRVVFVARRRIAGVFRRRPITSRHVIVVATKREILTSRLFHLGKSQTIE